MIANRHHPKPHAPHRSHRPHRSHPSQKPHPNALTHRHPLARYSVLSESQQLFASQYRLILPSEEELAADPNAVASLTEYEYHE